MKDKKKMIVLGLLALAIVSVGAFQFMGGSSPAAVASVAKKTGSGAAPSASPTPDAPKNPGVAQALPERDPFNVPKEALPSEAPVAPTPQTTAPRNSNPRIRNTEHFPQGIPTGTLPGPNGIETGPIGSGGTQPLAVPEPPFAYQVVGVMVGSRPCAVFADAQGNQRLVPLGGSLDPETKVTGIEKGKVTLSHRGKTLHFEVGGNPNAK